MFALPNAKYTQTKWSTMDQVLDNIDVEIKRARNLAQNIGQGRKAGEVTPPHLERASFLAGQLREIHRWFYGECP